MKYVKSNEGLTLVEVIASVVILSIILFSVFHFFTNAANFNSHNDSNIQANNVAREYENYFEQTYNNKVWTTVQSDFVRDATNPTLYNLTLNQDDYIILISINSVQESSNAKKEFRKVKIAVWKNKMEGKPLSETYTYHEGQVS